MGHRLFLVVLEIESPQLLKGKTTHFIWKLLNNSKHGLHNIFQSIKKKKKRMKISQLDLTRRV